MANTLKQRYNPVEAGQEAAQDVLSGLKDRLVGLLNGLKSGERAPFSTGYGPHEPTSRAIIDSDVVSVRMQYRYRNRQ